MDHHLHPHSYSLQRKRAYNDGSLIEDNNESTTLIGNNYGAAGSHSYSVNTQRGQQRRRTSQSFPSAILRDQFMALEENYSFQGSLQPPYQCALASNTPRYLTDTTAGSSLQTPSFDLGFNSSGFNQPQPQPPPQPLAYQISSSLFGHMRSDGWQGQQRRYLNVEGSIASGSEDSRTIYETQSLSRTTSLGGNHDLTSDTPNDVSRSSIPESTCSFTMTGDPADNDTINSLVALATHDQHDSYPELWQQQQGSQPWTSYQACYPQIYFSDQQVPLDAIDGEWLNGEPPLEPINASPLTPSQNPFLSSNISQTLGGMLIEEYTDTFQSPDDASFVDLECAISGDEVRVDVGIGGPSFNVYDQQSSYSEIPGSSTGISRSFQSLTRDTISSDFFTPLARQASVDTSYTMNHLPLVIQSGDPEERSRTVSDREPVCPKSKLQWENNIAGDGAILTLESQTSLNTSAKKTKGIRTKPLSDEAAKKAADVRRNNACVRCWVVHYPCAVKGVCARCSHQLSPYTKEVCRRDPLYEYTEVLFPDFVVARHSRAAITKVFKDTVRTFSGNEIQIEISSSPHYPPIVLSVFEFTPENDEFLSLYHAPPHATSSSSALERVYGPPVALPINKFKSKIKDEVKKHTKEMIKQPRFLIDATNGDEALVLRKIFEAINTYRTLKSGSGNPGLMRRAIRLLAAHFFMRKIISFTQTSAQKVYESLISPRKLPYERRSSSKLLNFQIKREVHWLQREWTTEILREVEADIRKKSLSLWSSCFSVLVILCMCIEAVQLSIDGFIVQSMLTGDTENTPSREDGFHKSRQLEHLLFGVLLDTFHLIYRSGKLKDFHPMRDGANKNNSKDLDQGSVQFINEIHQIVTENLDYLREKAQNPTLNIEENLLLDHYRFRRQNSGRLVARFLLSFYDA